MPRPPRKPVNHRSCKDKLWALRGFMEYQEVMQDSSRSFYMNLWQGGNSNIFGILTPLGKMIQFLTGIFFVEVSRMSENIFSCEKKPPKNDSWNLQHFCGGFLRPKNKQVAKKGECFKLRKAQKFLSTTSPAILFLSPKKRSIASDSAGLLVSAHGFFALRQQRYFPCDGRNALP